MVSPDGDIAFRVEEWIPAEVTCITSDEAVITDEDGWTYTIDADGWTVGQAVAITVDDGEIEDIRITEQAR